ncbi:hypothetical protein ACFL2R_01820 [Patescibacteria group bacterium]
MKKSLTFFLMVILGMLSSVAVGENVVDEENGFDIIRTITPINIYVENERKKVKTKPVIEEFFVIESVRSYISSRQIMSRQYYDYAPEVIVEYNGNNQQCWRMYWCGGMCGDYVYYSKVCGSISDSDEAMLSRFWGARQDYVLTPRRYHPTNVGDKMHTCDPVVVKANNEYYMYYGGFPAIESTRVVDGKKISITNFPNPGDKGSTYIMGAESNDGVNWRRMNNGDPIVHPYLSVSDINAWMKAVNKYGVGQPLALTDDEGYIYLMYTSSTAPGGSERNGAGIFVMRSKDPTFNTGVEELQCMTNGGKERTIGDGCAETGFVHVGTAKNTIRTHSVYQGFSISAAYVPEMDSFVFVMHLNMGKVWYLLTDKNFQNQTTIFTESGYYWKDGTGLRREANGHIRATKLNENQYDIPIVRFSGGHTKPNSSVNEWDIWGGAHILRVNKVQRMRTMNSRAMSIDSAALESDQGQCVDLDDASAWNYDYRYEQQQEQ